jgi:cbb3-type cytochrome oxidase subunit 1
VPGATIWLVRAALVHLLVGSALGALLLTTKAGFGTWLWVGRTWPLHGETMLLGWMVQLAIGVAYWILPKHVHQPVRGPVAPVIAAALLINLGVLSAGLGPIVGRDGLTLAGRLAELAAVLLFATNALPRIKEFGRGRV